MSKLPKLVVAAVVKNKGKYLLVKEKLESGRDLWIVPGGKVEFGESLGEAVIREVKEELGIDSQIVHFISYHQAIFPEYSYHTIIFFFLVKPLNGDLKLAKEILDAQYFGLKEIEKLSLVESAKWLFQNQLKI